MHYPRLFFLLCLLGPYILLHATPWWLESSYLLWTTKKTPLSAPLLTSASLTDPLPGALRQPGTKILMGDQAVDISWQNGARIALGGWITTCSVVGVEGSFFALAKKRHQQSIYTSGDPGSLNVAVPIYDVTGLWGLNGVPGETVFLLPGPLFGPGFEGRFVLKMTSQLFGSELNMLTNMRERCESSIEGIGGFRWIQLRESLLFIGQSAALPNSPYAGSFYNIKDSFKTDNNFYGPQVGLRAEYTFNSWLLNGFTKVALGCMQQTLSIRGRSQTSEGNLFYLTKNSGKELLKGGVFAEPTNRGSKTRNACAVALEAGVNLGCRFLRCIEIGAGYNILWLNQLLRPGEQIDRKINPTRTALAEASRESVGVGPDSPVPFGAATAAPLPSGPKRPKWKHHATNFWAQGLNVTINLSF